jgi:hypothetical protein
MADPIPPSESPPPQKRGSGGSPGGVGTFLVGLAMTISGGYLFLDHLTVTSGFSFFGWGAGRGSFGVILLVLLVGIAVLFFDSKSIAGWFLTAAATLVLVVSVVTNLDVFYRPTSLLNTLFMFGLFAGGLGLVFRSFKSSES